MNVAKDILERFGVEAVDEMAVNENYTVEVDGYDYLTTEKIGDDKVIVGHYCTLPGDFMSDPDIVFVDGEG